MYPGLTYIGGQQFVGLYGVNETIHDQKAIGLQHLFVDDYSMDLVHTGCNYVKVNNTVTYGDRIKSKLGHPLRKRSSKSSVVQSCVFVDQFKYEDYERIDSVTAYDRKLIFNCKVTNTTRKSLEVECGGLLITRNNLQQKCKYIENGFKLNVENKILFIRSDHCELRRLSHDSSSEFMSKGIQNILYSEEEDIEAIEGKLPIACTLSQHVVLQPAKSIEFQWEIQCTPEVTPLNKGSMTESIGYWEKWLAESTLQCKSNLQEDVNTILVALRALCLGGFLPADLTGHYFAKGQVCFYVRDALMASRAFMFSGHYSEFEQIIGFLLTCPRKENGEFYQRYNSNGLPDEGANNSVFSQMDVIGYFSSVIHDYYILSGKMIVPYIEFKSIIDFLKTVKKKKGLYGPEGGVNEGVYGPAYITSTNMFITAGYYCASSLANKLGEIEDARMWEQVAKECQIAVEATFLEDEFYNYGYVEYTDKIVRRYDSPQLLAASLGYPLTENFKRTANFLNQHASFFEHGIGYSEQEYHNGPWIFNTCGAGEIAYLLDNHDLYLDKIEWVKKHRNKYGMLPEAIDATNEELSFINPLMWASAEFVVMCYSEKLKEVRSCG